MFSLTLCRFVSDEHHRHWHVEVIQQHHIDVVVVSDVVDLDAGIILDRIAQLYVRVENDDDVPIA